METLLFLHYKGQEKVMLEDAEQVVNKKPGMIVSLRKWAFI